MGRHFPLPPNRSDNEFSLLVGSILIVLFEMLELNLPSKQLRDAADRDQAGRPVSFLEASRLKVNVLGEQCVHAFLSGPLFVALIEER